MSRTEHEGLTNREFSGTRAGSELTSIKGLPFFPIHIMFLIHVTKLNDYGKREDVVPPWVCRVPH